MRACMAPAPGTVDPAVAGDGVRPTASVCARGRGSTIPDGTPGAAHRARPAGAGCAPHRWLPARAGAAAHAAPG